MERSLHLFIGKPHVIQSNKELYIFIIVLVYLWNAIQYTRTSIHWLLIIKRVAYLQGIKWNWKDFKV